MPVTYTDVDRLMLERWDDTQGFLEAYEDLQERMQQVIADVAAPFDRWASTHGYQSDVDPKSASFSIHRPAWMNRRRDEALVYFALEDCAPIGYRRIKAEHPSLWLYTENLQSTKMKEADRVRFAADLRSKIGDVAESWRHDDASEADYPLGKKLAEVRNLDRVRLLSDSTALYKFATETFEQALLIGDAVDQTLIQLRTRD